MVFDNKVPHLSATVYWHIFRSLDMIQKSYGDVPRLSKQYISSADKKFGEKFELRPRTALEYGILGGVNVGRLHFAPRLL